MATLNNPRSDVIASTIEPVQKSTPALVHAHLLEIVGFRMTSCLCQNGFVARQDWVARQNGQEGPGEGRILRRVNPEGAAVKIPVRMTGSFQAGL
jgi:hypothetical protein